MKKADRNRTGTGPWAWQWVETTAYGVTRRLQVLSFQAVWPKVLGLRPILVGLVRDPEGKFKDTYLFTTDVGAELSWVIAAYSRRWSIEVAFKASKQAMKIEAPSTGVSRVSRSSRPGCCGCKASSGCGILPKATRRRRPGPSASVLEHGIPNGR